MQLIKWARVCGVASFAMACSTTQPGNGYAACLKGASVGLAAGAVSGGVATALQRDDREQFAITAAASSLFLAGVGCFVFAKRNQSNIASLDKPTTSVVEGKDGVRIISHPSDGETVSEVNADEVPGAATGVFDNVSISKLGPVQFDFASASLDAKAEKAISSLADKMKAAENSNQLLIIGHTCAHGSDLYNLQLAQQRADAVRSVLINSYGIAPSRILTEALGEANPLTGIDEFDPQNRRVELQVRAPKFIQNSSEE